MDVEDLFDLDNILFRQRKCRSCKQTKDLITDFYRSRPNRQAMSAYSYECKECTKKRIKTNRKTDSGKSGYPDW